MIISTDWEKATDKNYHPFMIKTLQKAGMAVVAQLRLTLEISWTVAHQATLSMGFSRPEYWNGLPFPSPGDLPNSGIKPASPVLAGGFLTAEPPGKPLGCMVAP